MTILLVCSSVGGDNGESEDEDMDREEDVVVECVEVVAVVEDEEYGEWFIVSGRVVNGVPGCVAVGVIEVSELEGEWPARQVSDREIDGVLW